MAKKTTKTRGSQYEVIVTSKGYNFNDCVVMSFAFPTESASHGYHYELIYKKLIPLIYDGPNDIVRIVVLKDDLKIERYKDIAEEFNGAYKECRAYNDYE